MDLGKLTVDFVAKGMDRLRTAISGTKADMESVDKIINRLKDDLVILGRQKVKIQADTSDAQERLSELKKALKDATGPRKVQIQADIARAEQRIAALKAQQRANTQRTSVVSEKLEGAAAAKAALEDQAKQTNILREGLGKLTAGLQTLAGMFARIGTVAGVAFGGAVAGIGKLVSIADPVGFAQMQAQLEIISIHVGRIFIPLLRDLTNWLRRVADYFRNLSAEQRQQIRDWARLGLLLTGIVAVGGKLISMLIGLVAPAISAAVSLGTVAVSALSTAVAAALAGNALAIVGLALAAIVAIVAIVVVAVVALGAALFVLGQKGDTLGEKLTNAWRNFKDFVMPIIQAVIAAWRRMFAVWSVLVEEIRKGITELLGLFGTDWAGVIEGGASIWQTYVETVIELWKKLTVAFAVGRAYLIPILRNLRDAFVSTWDSVSTVIGAVANIIGTVINTITSNLFGFETSWEGTWDSAESAFSSFVSGIQDLFLGLQVALIAASQVIRNVAQTIQQTVTNANNVLQALQSEGSPLERLRAARDAVSGNQNVEVNPLRGVDFGAIRGNLERTATDARARANQADQRSQAPGRRRTEDDTPTVMSSAPQLFDIADAFRRAQTAQQNDPRLEAERERLELQRRAVEAQQRGNEALFQIANNIGGVGGLA